MRIYVTSAVFQPYRDLEAGDNQSLKIQVARPGIEPRSSCSASQELNHSATAAPRFYHKVRLKFEANVTYNDDVECLQVQAFGKGQGWHVVTGREREVLLDAADICRVMNPSQWRLKLYCRRWIVLKAYHLSTCWWIYFKNCISE